ncbi:MAG: metallophosphoesterase family protein [Thermomicrobiales bacterium]
MAASLAHGLLTRERTFEAPLTMGVIADTHIFPGSVRHLHPAVVDLFRRAKVDLLIHLGDVNTRAILEELAEIAPLLAVRGNNDDAELQAMLPLTLRLTVGRFRVRALHGHGGRSAHDEAVRQFAGKADLVLFGHSHKPLMEMAKESILFNPGSATDRRWFDHFGVGVIRFDDERIDPELILFDHPANLVNIAFD